MKEFYLKGKILKMVRVKIKAIRYDTGQIMMDNSVKLNSSSWFSRLIGNLIIFFKIRFSVELDKNSSKIIEGRHIIVNDLE